MKDYLNHILFWCLICFEPGSQHFKVIIFIQALLAFLADWLINVIFLLFSNVALSLHLTFLPVRMAQKAYLKMRWNLKMVSPFIKVKVC